MRKITEFGIGGVKLILGLFYELFFFIRIFLQCCNAAP